MIKAEHKDPTAQEQINDQWKARFNDMESYLTHPDDMEYKELKALIEDQGYNIKNFIQHNQLDNEGRRTLGMINTDEIKEILEDRTVTDNILCITKYLLFEIQLSTGGPGDGLELIIDPESLEIIKAKYYYAEWFDVAYLSLTSSEIDTLQTLFEPYFYD